MVKNWPSSYVLTCNFHIFFVKYILKFFAHFLDRAVSPIINILHLVWYIC